MPFPTSSAFASDALARLPQNAAVLIFVAVVTVLVLFVKPGAPALEGVR